jgi:integrase/recombinase XerC
MVNAVMGATAKIGGAEPPLSCGPFEPEGDRWLSQLRSAGRAGMTLDCYARDLRDAGAALGEVLHRRISTADLARMGQAEVDAVASAWATHSSSTVARRFSALRSFARHLTTAGVFDCGRLLAAKMPSVVRGARAPLDAETAAAIVDRPERRSEETWIAVRNAAIFALVGSTAMTTAEVVGLDRGQVLGTAGAIAIVRTHLARRIVAADPDAEKLLRRYLAVVPFVLGPKDPLFVNRNGGRLNVRSVQVAFRDRSRELGLTGRASVMGLRHGVGLRLAEQGAAPAAVAQAMGISTAAAARYFNE